MLRKRSIEHRACLFRDAFMAVREIELAPSRLSRLCKKDGIQRFRIRLEAVHLHIFNFADRRVQVPRKGSDSDNHAVAFVVYSAIFSLAALIAAFADFPISGAATSLNRSKSSISSSSMTPIGTPAIDA